ncbi:MAG: N-acetyltransferase [Spirochaetaceae bacterium]|nr:MAG: N-acetyltransferase [Spirochaetaceae bacterium]
MKHSSESAGTPAFRAVTLLPEHSQEALALSAAAGWNQSGDDWHVMLQHGSGVGRRSREGRLVASIVTLQYGDVAWLAMLLTLQEFRGHGLGTQLFVSALDAARQSARVTALDATELGLPIYRQHGFSPLMVLRRLELRSAPRLNVRTEIAGIQPVAPDGAESAAELDAAVLGLDRRWLIHALWQQKRNVMLTDAQDDSSFLLLRHGRAAYQLGPLYAGSAATAMRLTEAALAVTNGQPVFVDVFDQQTEYLNWLRSIGFREQRSFTRMADTRPALQGRHNVLFAMTGPEFG